MSIDALPPPGLRRQHRRRLLRRVRPPGGGRGPRWGVRARARGRVRAGHRRRGPADRCGGTGPRRWPARRRVQTRQRGRGGAGSGTAAAGPPTGAAGPPTGAAGPPTGAGTGALSPSDQAARWAEGTRQAGSRGSGRSGRGSGRTTASGSTRGRLGAGLVDVPAVPRVDPVAALMTDPQVPEDRRFCRKCGHPVGRSRGDRPGRAEGFCPEDGERFSFLPEADPRHPRRRPVRGARLPRPRRPRLDLPGHRPQRRRPLGGAQGPARRRRRRTRRASSTSRSASSPRSTTPASSRSTTSSSTTATRASSSWSTSAARRSSRSWKPGAATTAPRAAAGGAGDRLRAGGPARARLPARPGPGLLRLQARQRHPVRPPAQADRPRRRDPLRRRGQAPSTARSATRHPRSASTARRRAPTSTPSAARSPCSPSASARRHRGAPTPLPDDHPVLARYESFHRLLLRATDPDPYAGSPPPTRWPTSSRACCGRCSRWKTARPRPAMSTVFAAPRGTFARRPARRGASRPPRSRRGWRRRCRAAGRPHRPGRRAARRRQPRAGAPRRGDRWPRPGPEVRLALARAELAAGDPAAALVELAAAAADDPDDWRVDWYRGVAALVTATRPRPSPPSTPPTRPSPASSPRSSRSPSPRSARATTSALAATTRCSPGPTGLADAAFGLARTALRAGDRATRRRRARRRARHLEQARRRPARGRRRDARGPHRPRDRRRRPAGRGGAGGAACPWTAGTGRAGVARRSSPRPRAAYGRRRPRERPPLLGHAWQERDLRLALERSPAHVGAARLGRQDAHRARRPRERRPPPDMDMSRREPLSSVTPDLPASAASPLPGRDRPRSARLCGARAAPRPSADGADRVEIDLAVWRGDQRPRPRHLRNEDAMALGRRPRTDRRRRWPRSSATASRPSAARAASQHRRRRRAGRRCSPGARRTTRGRRAAVAAAADAVARLAPGGAGRAVVHARRGAGRHRHGHGHRRLGRRQPRLLARRERRRPPAHRRPLVGRGDGGRGRPRRGTPRCATRAPTPSPAGSAAATRRSPG